MPFDFVGGQCQWIWTQCCQPWPSSPSLQGPSWGGPVSENAGLHAAAQFFRFKTTQLLNRTSSLGPQGTPREYLAHALRPTGYEAANYLIPTLEKHNQAQHIHSIGPIPSTSQWTRPLLKTPYHLPTLRPLIWARTPISRAF